MDFHNPAELRDMIRTLGGDEQATLDDGSQEGLPVYCIYNAPHEQVVMFPDGPGVDTSRPSVTVVGVDVQSLAAHGVRVEVAGQTLYIASPQPERPDWKGLALLILSEDEI